MKGLSELRPPVTASELTDLMAAVTSEEQGMHLVQPTIHTHIRQSLCVLCVCFGSVKVDVLTESVQRVAKKDEMLHGGQPNKQTDRWTFLLIRPRVCVGCRPLN